MEQTDRETHDFMKVESFPQLPFIRPSPFGEKSIRLFGKEFGGGAGADSPIVIINDESDSNDTAAVVQEESKETGESNRKFECHYCCRNFPTSQALGGHQNAHKRERQHAKRAHLQSAMFHGSLTEAQMYGLMNYHRLSAAPTHVTPNYHHQQPPSWRPYSTTSIINNSNRFYGGSITSRSHQTPINGSPLAMWRFPTARSSTLTDSLKASRIGTWSDSQIRYPYEQKPSVQDQFKKKRGFKGWWCCWFCLYYQPSKMQKVQVSDAASGLLWLYISLLIFLNVHCIGTLQIHHT